MSSVIIITSQIVLQIIQSRIQPQPFSMWNRPPGHLLIHQDFSSYPSDYPYSSGPLHMSHQFTAVITVTRPALRESSPLVRLLQVLAQSPRLAAVILVWAGVGPPQVGRRIMGI